MRCDSDVDHVPDELAELGFRANFRGELVERDWVEADVAAELGEVRELVDDGG